MNNTDIAFEGHVIRLNKKDYEFFWTQLGGQENNFLKRLSSIDDWMHKKDIGKKSWFFMLGSMLERDRQEAAVKQYTDNRDKFEKA